MVAAAEDNRVGFTQLGYGRLADYKGQVFIDDSTIVTGYQATNVSGERLFQNNLAREYQAPALVKDPITNEDAYFHPKVRFTTVGPPNDMGQGLGMGGDSGGPLFTKPPIAEVKIQVLRGGNNVQIPINYTDSLSAIFVASQPVTVTEMIDGVAVKTEFQPETVSNGSSQFAVPVNRELYDWIQPALANPRIIPEPSTLALALCSAMIVGSRVCRRRGLCVCQ